MLLRTHLAFFWKFHINCISQSPKIWWLTSVQARSTLFYLLPFWVASKQNNFCYEPIPNNAEFTSMKKYLKNIVLFHLYSPIYISTEKDIDTRLTKAWTAINRLSIIWKSDLTDKMKRSFFQAAVASILLYGCTTWTLTKRLEKKLDGNYTRMLRAILNKSWRQHPTRHQLYGHLPPITKIIEVRRTRHAGHRWRSRDELISDVLLWTPTKAGRPARTYIQQLCEDTGCIPEDLPEAMNDREKWRERVRDIRTTSTTWWWWWWWWYIYIYMYIYIKRERERVRQRKTDRYHSRFRPKGPGKYICIIRKKERKKERNWLW